MGCYEGIDGDYDETGWKTRWCSKMNNFFHFRLIFSISRLEPINSRWWKVGSNAKLIKLKHSLIINNYWYFFLRRLWRQFRELELPEETKVLFHTSTNEQKWKLSAFYFIKYVRGKHDGRLERDKYDCSNWCDDSFFLS